MIRTPRVTVLLVLLASLSADRAFAQIVTSELDVPPGATSSIAASVNNAGQIVGNIRYATPPLTRAVIWIGGTPTELPRLCPTCSTGATDINEAGDISGSATDANGVVHPAVWRGGVLSTLPRLPGHGNASATGINNLGVLAGVSRNADGVLIAVRWLGESVVESLGGLPAGFSVAIVASINDAGQVVGTLLSESFTPRAFAWSDGVFTLLAEDQHCDGSSGGASEATGNNNRGQIVGYAPGCPGGAVVWDNGVMRWLPPVPRPPMVFYPVGGTPHDINERGDIVGIGALPSPAALWRDGQAVEIGALGSYFAPPHMPTALAMKINDRGLAVGWSFGASDTVQHAVMWETMPNTPPTLTVPANLTAEATSPGGALVSFSATADDEEDGAFLPTCTPASGSLFAMGTTTVSCTATDSGGLDATGSFTVTVLGATAQIDALLADVTGAGPRSLENTLRVARGAIVAQRPLVAAVALRVFDVQVTVLAITRRLPVDQAMELLAASRQVRATLGY